MQRLFAILLGCLLSITLSVALVSPTYAQQTTGLTISPLRQETEVDPGFVASGEFVVENSGAQPRTIIISAETFNVINPSYDYVFKTGTHEVSWVSFSTPTLSLAPGDSAPVSFQVSVPIGTEPGGYYLAFFATNESPISSGGISSTERVTSLLYLSVTGDVSRTGQLVQLRSPIIVWNKDSWSATLQNSGSLHYRSTYSATVRSLFNQSVSSQEDSRLILPGSVRLIEAPLTNPDVLGIYKVTYSISLGDNPAVEEVRWFVYLPPLQIGLLILITIGIVILRRRRKKG